ncbi:MAG: carbohydrate-binding domain-containing protein, partial [Coriobacteriia bacterium]|nr:carbohydrate-binding domain-containing protein [Coriobacteriia bacterium]
MRNQKSYLNKAIRILLVGVISSGLMLSSLFLELPDREAYADEYGGYTVTDYLDGVGTTIYDSTDKVYLVTGGSSGYPTDGVIVINNTTPGVKTVLVLLDTYRQGLTSQIQVDGISNVVVYLVGDNTLRCIGSSNLPNSRQAGIYVAPNATLTIEGPGNLTSVAGMRSAGIGGIYNAGVASGTKIFNGSGTINARGDVISQNRTGIDEGGGAGIGGGNNGTGGTTIINSGTINAYGGNVNNAGRGSGIGGGGGSAGGPQTGGNITINGGNVTARSYGSSAAIGGGFNSNGNSVTITGGVVDARSQNAGTGIGAGGSSNCGIVNISGGIVTAYGSNLAAGIGSGLGVNGGTINITGGIVYARCLATDSSGVGGGGGGRATINITGGSVYSINATGMVRINYDPTNGAVNGNARVFMIKVELRDNTGALLPYTNLSIKVTGVTTYEYHALSNHEGVAYMWLPNGTYDYALYNPDLGTYYDGTMVVSVPANTEEYDPNTNTATYTISNEHPHWSISSDPDLSSTDRGYGTAAISLMIDHSNPGSHPLKAIDSVMWYRESLQNPQYTREQFMTGYAAAASGNKGVGGYGQALELVGYGPDPFNNQDYLLNLNRNGRYWFQITYKGANTGLDIVHVTYLDIDNVYTPVDVYIQEKLSGSGEVITSYTRLEQANDAPYGVPLDMDDRVLANPRLGYDYLTYDRNENMPSPYWRMIVSSPFSSTPVTASSAEMPLNATFMTTPDDLASNGLSRYFTVLYDLNPDYWTELEVYFVAPDGSALDVPEGMGLSSATIMVPLDAPISSPATSNNFLANGGMFAPPYDDIHMATGWYIANQSHSVSDLGSGSDPAVYFAQNDFTQFDPQLTFADVATGQLVDGKKLFIVFSQPDGKVLENYFDIGSLLEDQENKLQVREPSFSLIDVADPSYMKVAPDITGKVCVGYEILSPDYQTVLVPFVRYELPSDMPGDTPQSGLVVAEYADGYQLLHATSVVNFYYEDAVGGIPQSEVAYVAVRWRGERDGAYYIVQNTLQIAVRVGYDYVVTNDDSLTGDLLHRIDAEDAVSGVPCWIFDQSKVGNDALVVTHADTPGQIINVLFYYNYSTGGQSPDRDQFVTELYLLASNASALAQPTTSSCLMGALYEKTAPTIPGYIAVGWYRDTYDGSQTYTPGVTASFTRDAYAPDSEVVSFIYVPAAGVTVKSTANSWLDSDLSYFDEYQIVGKDGEVVTVVPKNFVGWNFIKAELNGVEIFDPYQITLNVNQSQELIFFYEEIQDMVAITVIGKAYDTAGIELYRHTNLVPRSSLPSSSAIIGSDVINLEPNWLLIAGQTGKMVVIPNDHKTVEFYYTPGFANITIKGMAATGQLYSHVLRLPVSSTSVGLNYGIEILAIPGYVLAAGQSQSVIPDGDKTLVFSYDSLETTVRVRMVDPSGADIQPSFVVGAVTGNLFTYTAPFITGWYLTSQSTLGVVNPVLGNGQSVLTFEYTRIDSHVRIICVDADTDRVIRIFPVESPVIGTATVPSPDLSAEYYIAQSANITYNYDGNNPVEVYAYYSKELVDIQVHNVDIIYGLHLEDGCYSITGVRKGEPITVAVHALVIPDGHVLIGSPTQTVIADDHSEVIFYFRTISSNEVLVSAIDDDTGNLIGFFIISGAIGSEVQVDAANYLGWQLADFEPMTKSATIGTDIEVVFKYVKDRVAISIEAIDDVYGNTLFENHFEISKGSSYTVYAPHIDDYVLLSKPIVAFTNIAASEKIVFVYRLADDFVNDNYVLITIRGVSRTAELYSYVLRVAKSDVPVTLAYGTEVFAVP